MTAKQWEALVRTREAGTTQLEVAELIGVDESTICRWEGSMPRSAYKCKMYREIVDQLVGGGPPQSQEAIYARDERERTAGETPPDAIR